MAPIQHFKTAFWSQKQPELTLPDFNAGYSVLHQKLNQSKVENEEIIAFFKERISIEEIYASKLVDQGKSSFKNSGFGRDEGAGLVKCFGQLKETSRRFGEQHKATATTVSNHVLLPLQEFHEEYKRNISNSKQAIDSMLKQFDGLVKEAEKTRYTYHRKCKEADKAEELAVRNATTAAAATATQKTVDDKTSMVPGPEDSSSSTQADAASATPDNSTSIPATINVQLGNQVMPQSELDSLVRRMRQGITVNDHRVPILGTYKNTSTGEDIAIWLQQNLPQCKDSPAMADVVGQQLIQPYNILRLIGQRGNKFVASANSFYQWRVAGDDDTSSITSTSGNSSTNTALGGLMDKIAVVQPTATAIATSEEPHKRARREAEKSDQAYRTAVLKLDQLRMAIEEAMFAHLTEMEQVELHRIEQLKKVISSFIAAMSVAIPQDKIVIEEMMVFQESLKPDQDIQFIVQQYAVSGFSPKAILYDNYYHGISHDQVFGVPLEELGKQSQDHVSKFVSIILEAVDKGVDKVEDVDTKQRLWSTPCALDRVHATCMELNTRSDNLTLETVEKYEPDLLVAVLRYFLLELPECLLTYEFYDPVQALIGGTNDEQDESLRLSSFSNLIATLPATHFATLKSIFASITSFIKKTSASTENINNISQSLGPVILRSRVESFTILNSKTPVKFAQELINHFDSIFSESTLKLHAESEKRRLAKPIIAVQQQEEKTNKRGSSLMSFMRPTINTAEELNKWTVNSMMGVFQRNSNTAASPTNIEQQSPLTRSMPLSFGSTITRQESPPSSPAISPSASVPEAKKEGPTTVMFDGGDDIFDEKEGAAHASTDEILKDIDSKPEEEKKTNHTQPQTTRPVPEQIDSSFFDDDDDE
ncbi:Rho-GTPase-activating protein 8 [Mucor circinelloides]